MASVSFQDACMLAKDNKSIEVLSLLEGNANWATEKDSVGRTLLHWAALSDDSQFVKNLIDRGIAVNDKDDMGWTPLMIACSAGREEVVKFLLENETDVVNLPNINGQTCLHYAASKGHFNIVKMLLENNAKVDVKDKFGSTPLHRSASLGRTKITELLVSRSSGIDTQDSTGNTPLHVAVQDDAQSDALLLVKAGAALDCPNKDKKTPLDCTSSQVFQNKLVQASKGGSN